MVDMLLLAQPLIDIERAAGEELAGRCWLIYALISVCNESGGTLRERKRLTSNVCQVPEENIASNCRD